MDQQTIDLINNEITSNEVCLFMKGTPEAPQCCGCFCQKY